MVETYLALLRGINVGGNNKLPMAEVSALFTQAGCRNVRTYIQSGNIIFRADPMVLAPLSNLITTQLQERFSYHVPIVIRTSMQMADIVRTNPFITEGVADDMLHVLFLADRPNARSVEALDGRRSPPDEFIVRGQEVFLRLPNGAGRSKLTTSYFDRMLDTTSTGRNWRTVTTLLEMMKS